MDRRSGLDHTPAWAGRWRSEPGSARSSGTARRYGGGPVPTVPGHAEPTYCIALSCHFGPNQHIERGESRPDDHAHPPFAVLESLKSTARRESTTILGDVKLV